MDPIVVYVLFIIALALLFDFSNGLNDAANSIATVVATRVLSPRLAVVWAAFFNFVAAFGFSTHVASTIGKGLIQPHVISPHLVLAALLAAILWTVVCTWQGLPISVSHALIGAMAGAALRRRLQSQSRPERRPEDHGHHLCPADERARLAELGHARW
jgi:PiT family inorganic phosphate transporter